MPFYRSEFVVPFAAQDVAARLRALVAPRRSFFEQGFWSANDAGPPFFGTLDEHGFQMRRAIRYRNAFLPIVRGSMVNCPAGTRVRLTMHLHPVVALFMLLWFWGLGTVSLELIREAVPLALLPVGLLFFGGAVLYLGFFPEALRAKHMLEQGLALPK